MKPMPRWMTGCCLLAASLALSSCQTMQRSPFVAVSGYGEPFDAHAAAMPVDPALRYRVVFPATRAAASPDAVLPALDRAARLLNLLGRAGRKTQPGDVVVVIYGPATSGVISDPAWRALHPEASGNPNLPLIRALRDAGVVVSVCSQALHVQKIADTDIDPAVRRDVSAMTTLASLQAKGYAVIAE